MDTEEEKSDEDIVLSIKKGNKEDFGILMHRYSNKLKRYAKKFLYDREDTDDLLQNIFIKAYQNLAGFDASRRFSPWIYRIAHNEFVNNLKRKLSQKLIFIDFDNFLPVLPAKEESDKMTNDWLNEQVLDAHLKELDPKYREVLILYFYEEMDYKEIGEILEIPVSTVGVRITRGKDKLKLLLKDKSI